MKSHIQRVNWDIQPFHAGSQYLHTINICICTFDERLHIRSTNSNTQPVCDLWPYTFTHPTNVFAQLTNSRTANDVWPQPRKFPESHLCNRTVIILGIPHQHDLTNRNKLSCNNLAAGEELKFERDAIVLIEFNFKLEVACKGRPVNNPNPACLHERWPGIWPPFRRLGREAASTHCLGFPWEEIYLQCIGSRSRPN
jgi:hypothetical protein